MPVEPPIRVVASARVVRRDGRVAAADAEREQAAPQRRFERGRPQAGAARAEATAVERVGAIEESIAPLTLAYLPSTEGVELRITAWGLRAEEVRDPGRRQQSARCRSSSQPFPALTKNQPR